MEMDKSTVQGGEIKRLFKERGFGFIQHDETREDLFFHASELVNVEFKDLEPGDRVSFLPRERNGKWFCIDVVVEEKANPTPKT